MVQWPAGFVLPRVGTLDGEQSPGWEFGTDLRPVTEDADRGGADGGPVHRARQRVGW